MNHTRCLQSLLLMGMTCALGCPVDGLAPTQDEPPPDMAWPKDQGQDQPVDQSAQDMRADMSTPSCKENETACGSLCVDLDADPSNCGKCGRTCVLPNAEAACVGGACDIATCDDGFFDDNKDFSDGCESQSQCEADQACMTSCNTQGKTTCIEGQATCTPPTETCNGLDDDCDGQCDPGLNGCRGGIHRGRNSGHIYTNTLGDITTVEKENYFYLYKNAPANSGNVVFKPVFLCTKPDGKKFLTPKTDCEIGRGPDKQLGFWTTNPACGAVPLYRLYHSGQGNHFYTTSAPERDNAANNLGYRFEFIAGYVWTKP